MRVLLTAAAITALCAATMAQASSSSGHTQIKGDDLRAVFSGTTMVGEYVTYRDETKTYNYTELHFKGGDTDYIEGKQREKGQWRIVGDDKICYKYPKSQYYMNTYCFFVYETEGCYYKYALPSMTLRGPRSWDMWSSRAVRKGHGGSCATPIG